MFCPKCGSQQPDGIKFCGNCGASLEGGAPSVDAGSPSATAQQPKAPKKKVPVIPIVIGIAAVAAIAIGALVLPGIISPAPSFNGSVAFGKASSDNPEEFSGSRTFEFSIEDGEIEVPSSYGPYIGTVDATHQDGESLVFTTANAQIPEDGDYYGAGSLLIPSSDTRSNPNAYFVVPQGLKEGNPVGVLGTFTTAVETQDNGSTGSYLNIERLIQFSEDGTCKMFGGEGIDSSIDPEALTSDGVTLDQVLSDDLYDFDNFYWVPGTWEASSDGTIEITTDDRGMQFQYLVQYS